MSLFLQGIGLRSSPIDYFLQFCKCSFIFNADSSYAQEIWNQAKFQSSAVAHTEICTPVLHALTIEQVNRWQLGTLKLRHA